MKYVAELAGVLDVTLRGATDPAYWRARGIDGATEAMLVAADAKFKGIRFREVSFSLLVDGGAHLVQAFNSVRFFAWVERVRFKTPYAHAQVVVSANPPSIRAGSAIHAEMRGARAPRSIAPDAWTGRVHLDHGRYFIAAISGETERYAFDASDVITTPWPFVPHEWLVRRNARHAKSATHLAQSRNNSTAP